MCKVLQINKKITTAHHPQTNDLVERMNRDTLDYISKFRDFAQKNWDKQIPFLVFSLNTTIKESTKEISLFFNVWT